MGNLNSVARSTKETGLLIVYEPPKEDGDVAVDIVAIHGLNGDRESTWTDKSQTKTESKRWLQDFLGPDLKRARIYSYGYNVDIHTATAERFLHDHANDLVVALVRERTTKGSQRIPLLFLAHSLGGLVVKKALFESYSRSPVHLAHQRPIHVSTYGIIFLGTPHEGCDEARFAKALADMSKTVTETSTTMLSILRSHSGELQATAQHFTTITDQYQQRYGYEIFKTRIGWRKTLIVPRWSAAPSTIPQNCEAWSFNTNHTGLVKYRERNDDYDKIFHAFDGWIKDAPNAVREKWRTEDYRNQPIPEPVSKSLYFIDMEIPTTTHEKGTLNWVSDPQNTLGHWLAAKADGIFMVTGKPGSGKSTLMAMLPSVESSDLWLMKGDGKRTPFLFIFKKFGSDLVKSMGGLYRALLHDLIKSFPTLLSHFHEQTEAIESYAKNLDTEGLRRLSSAFIRKMDRGMWFTLYIDALDECTLYTMDDLTFIRDLPKISGGKVRVCVSSRPDCEFEATLEPSETLVMEDNSMDDIETYVSSHLSTLGYNNTPSLRNEIISKADGVFLWVRIVVAELKHRGRGLTDSELGEIVKSPENIQELLWVVVGKALSLDSTSSLLPLFRILCCARRSLRETELRHLWTLSLDGDDHIKSIDDLDHSPHAIKHNRMLRDRIAHSRGLVEIVHNTSTDTNDRESDGDVRFMHHTVRECFQRFFDARLLDVWRHPERHKETHQYQSSYPLAEDLMDESPEVILAFSCGRFISMTGVLSGIIEGSNAASYVSHYAVEYWFEHFLAAKEYTFLRPIVPMPSELHEAGKEIRPETWSFSRGTILAHTNDQAFGVQIRFYDKFPIVTKRTTFPFHKASATEISKRRQSDFAAARLPPRSQGPSQDGKGKGIDRTNNGLELSQTGGFYFQSSLTEILSTNLGGGADTEPLSRAAGIAFKLDELSRSHLTGVPQQSRLRVKGLLDIRIATTADGGIDVQGSSIIRAGYIINTPATSRENYDRYISSVMFWPEGGGPDWAECTRRWGPGLHTYDHEPWTSEEDEHTSWTWTRGLQGLQGVCTECKHSVVRMSFATDFNPVKIEACGCGKVHGD